MALAGCAPSLPRVDIKLPPTHQTPLAPSGKLLLGDISCSDGNQFDCADYVRGHLTEQLAQRNIALIDSDSHGPAQIAAVPAVLHGHVRLVPLADPTRPAAMRIITTFTLAEAPSKPAIWSCTLESIASQDQLRTALYADVDLLLDKLYPKEQLITGRFHRGWSRFDRQGRRQAAQRNYAAALTCFRQAIDARPDDHAALYNAGLVCEATGDYQRGYERTENILREK